MATVVLSVIVRWGPGRTAMYGTVVARPRTNCARTNHDVIGDSFAVGVQMTLLREGVPRA
jgi:hypothetical protein